MGQKIWWWDLSSSPFPLLKSNNRIYTFFYFYVLSVDNKGTIMAKARFLNLYIFFWTLRWTTHRIHCHFWTFQPVYLKILKLIVYLWVVIACERVYWCVSHSQASVSTIQKLLCGETFPSFQIYTIRHLKIKTHIYKHICVYIYTQYIHIYIWNVWSYVSSMHTI